MYKILTFPTRVMALLCITMSLNACRKDRKPIITPSYPTEKEHTAIVSTVAGNGPIGLVNGPVALSRFSFPADVLVNTTGEIYVSDKMNSCIRKISNDQVSTLVGNLYGIVDGNAITARFKSPYSMARDAAGNIYLTDEGDPRIRKIALNGEVTTYAGQDTPGFADGEADQARFGLGSKLAADLEGNLYVADSRNNRIRKVSKTGKVITFAGTGVSGSANGDGLNAQFDYPSAITIDKDGNLYVLDAGNLKIRKITPTGIVSNFAGSGNLGYEDGKANEAQFTDSMYDVVADKHGNLFVLDEYRIRKVSVQGDVSTIAGSRTGFKDGDIKEALFNYPGAIDIDAKGDLYIVDFNRIRKITFN